MPPPPKRRSSRYPPTVSGTPQPTPLNSVVGVSTVAQAWAAAVRSRVAQSSVGATVACSEVAGASGVTTSVADAGGMALPQKEQNRGRSPAYSSVLVHEEQTACMAF